MNIKKKDNFKSITVVVGLGRSGIAAAKLLNLEGFKVIVIEKAKGEKYEQISRDLESLGIYVVLGKPLKISSFQPWLTDISCVVISPSIPWDHITLNSLRALGISVKGEISLAWEKLKHIPSIGITGTNGKTTVTKMLGHLFHKNKIAVSLGGNIGVPASEIAFKILTGETQLPKWLVIELSSYQIESAPEISPSIGIWTTFTPDHLERHKTLQKYFDIKKGLLENSFTRIYNSDDKYLKNNRKVLGEGIWISAEEQKNDCENQYWINKKGIIFEGKYKLFNSSILKIPGKHNLQNLLMVIAAARTAGLSPESIKESLTDFKGVKHRLEFIGKAQSLKFYNDSKATNYDSSNVALEAINAPLILIAGGIAKEGDSNNWTTQINNYCHGVVLFGSSASLLQLKISSSGFKKKVTIVRDLNQAVKMAISMAEEERVSNILLSPACSSFDQYKDFEERGNHFREIISPLLSKGERNAFPTSD